MKKKTGAKPAAKLSDDELLEFVQRETFRYFWEGAHPVSFMALDRRYRSERDDDKVTTGGTGFAVMAFIVAVERQWVTRDEAIERLSRMLDILERGTC